MEKHPSGSHGTHGHVMHRRVRRLDKRRIPQYTHISWQVVSKISAHHNEFECSNIWLIFLKTCMRFIFSVPIHRKKPYIQYAIHLCSTCIWIQSFNRKICEYNMRNCHWRLKYMLKCKPCLISWPSWKVEIFILDSLAHDKCRRNLKLMIFKLK